MRSLFPVRQFLVIACVLQFLVQDIECKKGHDTGCQSCYDEDESSCDPCYNERSSKKAFKMPKIKMPKIKKSKKSKKHSCDEEDECQSPCRPMYMYPPYCPQPYPQQLCSPRYMQPCGAPQRFPDPCYRPPPQICSRPYPQPCPPPQICSRPYPQPCPPPWSQPCPSPCPPPYPYPCSRPCPQPCQRPSSLPCSPPQPCPLPCSRPCSQSSCASNCQLPCFESTLRSSCDPTQSVQKIIVEKGPAIIQNIIFDKEFCEKYFETYGCYPAIDGLPFQLPTQHVNLGNNCDDDCSASVNSFPCTPNRDICGPPCQNDCGRSPCTNPLPFPVSQNRYYPSPCPC